MKIEKKAIYVGHSTVVLLSIYTYKHLEGEVLSQDDAAEEYILNIPPEILSQYVTQTAEDAAKEFIKQLSGRCTPRFLKALANEITTKGSIV